MARLSTYVAFKLQNVLRLLKRGRKVPIPPPIEPEVGFPMFWIYYGTNGAGSPIMTSPGVFNMALLAQAAKRNLITINAAPFTNTNAPDNLAIVSLLRAANPNIKILWYDQSTERFGPTPAPNDTPASQWNQEWTHISSGPDKRLRCLDGTGFPYNLESPIFWNMGSPGAGTAHANIWKSFLQGKADGYFFDTFIAQTGNWQGGVGVNSSPLNFAAHGYASLAALNAACLSEATAFANAMLATGEVWINRGLAAVFTPDSLAYAMTGELVEGFDAISTNPLSPPTWDQYMTDILAGPLPGPSPTGNGTLLFKSETGTPTPAQGLLNRMIRYNLGSACVAGGLGFVGNDRDGANDPGMWGDEYAVTPAGVADVSGAPANRGWLGRPVAYGFKDAATGMFLRRFERGIVLVNGTGSSKSYDLGQPYRRIAGVLDPAVNDGSLVTNVTVPNKDGRFLRNP
jgi:hypothetical protein